MRGAEVARVRRVAVRRGQRRSRVRRRDGGQACGREGRDAADGLVRAGRADEPDDGAVGGQLLGRGRAASGVHRPSSVVSRMSWPMNVSSMSSMRDLDAPLGVLAEAWHPLRTGHPRRRCGRLAGRDLDGAERISRRRAGRRLASGRGGDAARARRGRSAAGRGAGGRDEHRAERERAELPSIHRMVLLLLPRSQTGHAIHVPPRAGPVGPPPVHRPG